MQADPDELISNICVRPTFDGGIRVILNLIFLNQQCVGKIQFKIESLKSAINAMASNCYLALLDLKEAFYSIQIREMDRKYYRFYWRGPKITIYFFDHRVALISQVFHKDLKASLCNAS